MLRHRRARVCCLVTAVLGMTLLAPNLRAQDVVPHAQDRPPGPALSPQEAMAKMQLPPGFKAELVTSEPHLVNPTAMTFDDRGRIWVCESVEYPRKDPGPGKDRVKIFEDTDGDGRFEKVTVFTEGLNIPCGVAIGNGGVYVTNAPDILFLRDTDGDDKADTREVILTGFGRDDTHELPNNLTWGPDGWLYGMNGVFNPARVKDPASGKVYDFTCAVWRYHPPTKRFELFAEGTSNPWGLDYNRQGDWFVSTCVIDHLFHITQSGYYTRQGGPYPPNTVPLTSITTERHQKAAYAGLVQYDADVYPSNYRGKLIMGNLHGSCLNVDRLERNGSTYKQSNDPDFLSANDAWFMPVAQRLGPDGCVYVMDWYDRYHCYQDANRDSPGLDRLKGRIYRITFNDAPHVPPFDLSRASTDQLVEFLGHSNAWWRRTAQRLLNERYPKEAETLRRRIERMALTNDGVSQAHMHAMWLLCSQPSMSPEFHENAMASDDPVIRGWAVRMVGVVNPIPDGVYDAFKKLANDPSPDVRLQVAIAAGRLHDPNRSPLPVFEALLRNAENASDPLIPNILYQNIKPHAARHGRDLLALFNSDRQIEATFRDTVVRWVREGVAAIGLSPAEIVAQLDPVLENPEADPRRTAQALQGVINAFGQLGVPPAGRAKLFDPELRRLIGNIAAGRTEARIPATVLGMWFDDPKALEAARGIVADRKADAAARSELLKALAERKDPKNFETFAAFIADDGAPRRLRREAIDALGATGDAASARAIASAYAKLEAELKPVAVNALTRTAASGTALLDAIESKAIPAAAVTANHVRQIHALGDKSLGERVTKLWGAVKTERDPERVKIVERMRESLRSHKGDALRGQAVFTKACAQCHVIYGQPGGTVGPDLTGVGRENLDAILTNVIDPNLVIGAGYFVNVARLKDGTVVSGVLVEESDQRVVLKDQTKTHTLNRADIARLVQQNISMMPEGLEQTVSEQEFADLVSFLLTRESPGGAGAGEAGR